MGTSLRHGAMIFLGFFFLFSEHRIMVRLAVGGVLKGGHMYLFVRVHPFSGRRHNCSSGCLLGNSPGWLGDSVFNPFIPLGCLFT